MVVFVCTYRLGIYISHVFYVTTTNKSALVFEAWLTKLTLVFNSCVCVPCVCVCRVSVFLIYLFIFFSSQQQHQQQLAHVSTPKWEKTKIMNSEGCTAKYSGCSSQFIIKWVLYRWDKIAYNNLCCCSCCVSGFMYINNCTVTNKFIFILQNYRLLKELLFQRRWCERQIIETRRTMAELFP